MKPWLDSDWLKGSPMWQQDSAPGHKAIQMQKWFQKHLAGCWPSPFWPLPLPNCSPLDYSILGYVESKACASPHTSADALKAFLKKEWATMSTNFIIKV